MTTSFFLYDHGRFGRILILAILLHLIFLIGLDVLPPSSPSLKRKMATLFDTTLNNKANQRQPRVAVNISTKSHASLVLETTKEKIVENLADELQVMAPVKQVKDSVKNLDVPPLPVPVKPMIVPRRRIVSAAAHEAKDAAYLASWQAYVEKYGNSHYPELALKNDLRGNLRLLVAINRDGSLREVSLRKSSGSPILDQAAINIVLQSAPFDPLPEELAGDFEVLEIIRTWQFRGKLSTSS